MSTTTIDPSSAIEAAAIALPPLLPPFLRAALPPGEPEAKALPKASQLSALRKRLLEQADGYGLQAELPEPLKIEPEGMRHWLAQQLERVDTRMLGLLIRRVRQHAWDERDEPAGTLIHWLALQHGVPVALQTLIEAARWRMDVKRQRLHQGAPSGKADLDFAMASQPMDSLWQCRGHWMQAAPAVRADGVAQLQACWAQLPLSERVEFAIALPELRPLAVDILDAATPEQAARWLKWWATARR